MDIRQAIVTKYISPTNFRGSRVKARCLAKSMIFDWDHALTVEQNHIKAAEILFIELSWNEEHRLKCGALPTGEYCFVLVPKPKRKKRRTASTKFSSRES